MQLIKLNAGELFLETRLPPPCIPFNCIACIARHDKIVHRTCIADHYFLSFDPLYNNHNHYSLAFEVSDNTQHLIIQLYSIFNYPIILNFQSDYTHCQYYQCLHERVRVTGHQQCSNNLPGDFFFFVKLSRSFFA